MNVKTLMIAGATALSLAAPAAAFADPDWGRDSGYHDGGYYDRGDHDRGDWRDHSHYARPAYGWGYGEHCWTQVRPYRTWFGGIAYHRVWECR